MMQENQRSQKMDAQQQRGMEEIQWNHLGNL